MDISVTSMLLRLLHPVRLYRAFRAGRESERLDRTALDPQLKLYADILGHEHLHYGFFEDPTLSGAEISLRDLRRAQGAYSELLLRELPDPERPVLDCGCGMGGFLELLSEHGYEAVGLTPDEAQVDFIAGSPGDHRVHQTRFEELDVDRHARSYGAVVCAESLQYLDLEAAFEVAGEVLAPDGRWIICDYFRRHDRTHEASGHLLEEFRGAVDRFGWSVRKDRDITENVLVTLRYAHTLADRLGRSLVDFLIDKASEKHPVAYELYRDEIGQLRERLDREMRTIDPEQFRRDKSYRLFVLTRS